MVVVLYSTSRVQAFGIDAPYSTISTFLLTTIRDAHGVGFFVEPNFVGTCSSAQRTFRSTKLSFPVRHVEVRYCPTVCVCDIWCIVLTASSP